MHVHGVARAGLPASASVPEEGEVDAARFELLDVELVVASNRRRLLAPVRALLAAFESEAVPGPSVLSGAGPTRCEIVIECLSESRQRLTIDGRPFEIAGGEAELLGHLYAVLFDTVFERSRSALLIHGAALVRKGEATIVSGPSGTGKSTLAFVGARRFGWELSSDDVAPLDLESRSVRPFPKALSIRQGVLEPDELDGEYVEFPVLGARSKCLFQPADVGISVATSDAKLKRLVLLSRPERAPAVRSPEVTVVVHQCSRELIAGIANSRHVARVRWSSVSEVDSPYPHLRIEFENELMGMWDVTRACRAMGALVLGVDKSSTSGGGSGAFLDAPTLERLDLESATRATLRNLWGTAQFGGSGAKGAVLFGRVAAALDGVECFRLCPGPFEATLETLRTVIES